MLQGRDTGTVPMTYIYTCGSGWMMRFHGRLTLFTAAPLLAVASVKAAGVSLRMRPSSLPVINRSRTISAITVDVDLKLEMLRTEMAENGLDALIIPSGDPHLSEYVHPHYQRRAFISGFTGSAGTALVTKDSALLWTDGRYFLQAEEELGVDWTLMRSQQPGVPTMEAWLASTLADGAAVGIDAQLHSVDEAEKIEAALGPRRSLKSLETNLVDRVWEHAATLRCDPRPAKSTAVARCMPLKFAGSSREEKLSRLSLATATAGGGGVLVSALDEVAWLLNVRGSDVPHCPLLQSHFLMHVGESDLEECDYRAFLFIDEAKLDPELKAELAHAGVELAPYDHVTAAVRQFAQSGRKLLIDPKAVNYELRTAAGTSAHYHPSTIAMEKACKNEAELHGMMQAHLLDGAALAHFFAWLEETVITKRTALTEVEIATRLAQFRAQQAGFLDLSFPTIAGVGANGAIIHYNPLQAAKPARFDGSQLVLLDSGGQYECGTTDVTRTFHLGSPTEWQRQCFTLVLKGNIGLDTAVFPKGTPGPALDAFARLPLWKAGLDYLHGTGHGVGAALNVHEGPMSISTRYQNTVGLAEGMVVSNEPGYYEPGAFGIRIENLLIAHKIEVAGVAGKPFNDRTYLGFTQLTHVPIQKSLISMPLLTAAEIEWLNSYHSRVWDRVSPLLSQDSQAYQWLYKATRPI